MSKVSFDGATGKVAFDEFGDTTTKVLTVYKVEGGKWVADKTGEGLIRSGGGACATRAPPLVFSAGTQRGQTSMSAPKALHPP